ncbi:MAG: D-alanyl-D-alanine carboxypeptidase/D-alanyl-D-alanine-endopeptidase [Gemmatimonadetes bacterium]|nr:D-alanyl-D-alanine carboxypeptidase/D-alanyl-D-alanine-endopeptidase [Gemmatimonadota bacterium]
MPLAKPPRPDATEDLRDDLERLIRERGWSRAAWSVLAVSLDRGDTLFAFEPESARIPASNMKLFTSAAALYFLGPDFRYTTYLLTDGFVEDGVLRGNLVLYGTGDPTLADRFHKTKTAVFEQFAEDLIRIGIRRIEGEVVGDASHFVGPEVAPGWSDRYLEDAYAAPASALSFNENVVGLSLRPGASAGAPPRISMVPEGASVAIENRAQTVASPGGARLLVDRPNPTSPIVITGRISRGHRGVWRGVTVPDPAHFAASVLRSVLVSKGIDVTGPARGVHDPGESLVSGQNFFAPGLLDGGPIHVLTVYRSPPLADILAVVNKRSHNLYAELILKTIGRLVEGEGSFAAGARVVQSFLTNVVGLPPGQVEIHDGSGLSPANRASATALVTVLRFLAESPNLWEPFWLSLPEAGSPDGLRRMFRTAAARNLRAKTGTIQHVSALSGYVQSHEGERIAFSILVNEAPSTWRAKRIEDQIAVRLASFRRSGYVAPVVAAVAPSPSAARGTHRVKPGETFSSIARGYGVTLSALLEANPGIPPDRLQAGKVIRIPAAGEAVPPSAGTHRVRPGETLTSIARRYGVSLSALETANPGVSPRRLLVGQVIRIPSET